MNHKKILITMFVVLVVAVIMLFVLKKKQPTPAAVTTAPTNPQPVASTTPAATPQPTAPAEVAVNQYPIYYLKKAEDVKLLQKAIGFTGSNVDGIIGQNTLAKLNSYGFGLTNAFQIQSRAVLDGMIAKINTINLSTINAVPPMWLGVVNK